MVQALPTVLQQEHLPTKALMFMCLKLVVVQEEEVPLGGSGNINLIMGKSITTFYQGDFALFYRFNVDSERNILAIQ